MYKRWFVAYDGYSKDGRKLTVGNAIFITKSDIDNMEKIKLIEARAQKTSGTHPDVFKIIVTNVSLIGRLLRPPKGITPIF